MTKQLTNNNYSIHEKNNSILVLLRLVKIFDIFTERIAALLWTLAMVVYVLCYTILKIPTIV